MTSKTVITGLLLAFVAVSIVYLVAMEHRNEPASEITTGHPPTTEGSEESAPETTDAGRTLIVYYFHGNKRCNTCRTIEEYTEAAINLGYPRELQSGRLVWKAINVDEPENGHFVQDYELTTRTVVLVDVDRGNTIRWTKLERVWQLVRNKEEFIDYITDNTEAYLADGDG